MYSLQSEISIGNFVVTWSKACTKSLTLIPIGGSSKNKIQQKHIMSKSKYV
jgi:hypothetical protein